MSSSSLYHSSYDKISQRLGIDGNCNDGITRLEIITSIIYPIWIYQDPAISVSIYVRICIQYAVPSKFEIIGKIGMNEYKYENNSKTILYDTANDMVHDGCMWRQHIHATAAGND
jgi:hypothetical protein